MITQIVLVSVLYYGDIAGPRVKMNLPAMEVCEYIAALLEWEVPQASGNFHIVTECIEDAKY